jgi:uncharacterized repeat protein (TIGR01451 family)
MLYVTCFLASPVSAQTPVCAPINGGGPACVQYRDFSVNKQIQAPDKKSFQDNLTAPNTRFSAGQMITFRLIVRNTSNNQLKNIIVTDTLPTYLTFINGDGTYNFNNRTFSATVATIEKGQSKTLALNVKVVPANNLPTSPSPVCLSNLATAKQGNNTSQDTAVFCIDTTTQAQSTRTVLPSSGGSTTKGGLPIQGQPTARVTPSTGPETITLLSILLPSLGGLYLRRKTS